MKYYCKFVAAFICLLFSLGLSAQQRSIDVLVDKYKKNPKEGMEIFELSDKTKKETLDIADKYGSAFPFVFGEGGKGYEKIVDQRAISCTGSSAKKFYDEVIAFFDTQKGYTSSRTRIDKIRGKGYTLVSKDKNGNTIKETNTILFFLSDKEDSDSADSAVIMTIVTRED